MNKDQVKGRAKQVEGSIKKGAGKAVGNDRLQVEGEVEKAVGKVQANYGDLKNTIDKNS